MKVTAYRRRNALRRLTKTAHITKILLDKADAIMYDIADNADSRRNCLLNVPPSFKQVVKRGLQGAMRTSTPKPFEKAHYKEYALLKAKTKALHELLGVMKTYIRCMKKLR